MATWAGYGLSSFADSYLRTRGEMSRENEMDQIAQLRKQQAQVVQQQLQEREDAAKAAGAFAGPGAQDAVSNVTLAQGVPDTLPTTSEVAGPPAPQGPPSPQPAAGDAGPASGADVLRSQPQPGAQQPAPGPQPTSAGGLQPGDQVTTPGAPGTAPLIKRFRTQADAKRLLDQQEPGLYERLASTANGRALLHDQYGVTTDTEIASHQKRAQSWQDAQGLLKKSDEQLRNGEGGNADLTYAAALERLAEGTDNETERIQLVEKARAARLQGRTHLDDEDYKKDQRAIMEAHAKLTTGYNPQNFADFMSAALGAKTKAGLDVGGRTIDAVMNAHKNDPTGAFYLELTDAMRQTGGNIPKAYALMYHNPQGLSDAARQMLPEVIQSKNPEIQKVFGLNDDTLEAIGKSGSEFQVAAHLAMQRTKTSGLDPNSAEGAKAFQANYVALLRTFAEAKKDPNYALALRREFAGDLKAGQANYRRALEEWTKVNGPGHGKKEKDAAESYLNQMRDAANSTVDQINTLISDPAQKYRHMGDNPDQAVTGNPKQQPGNGGQGPGLKIPPPPKGMDPKSWNAAVTARTALGLPPTGRLTPEQAAQVKAKAQELLAAPAR